MKRENLVFKKNRTTFLKAIIGISVLLIILYVLRQEVRNFNFSKSLDILRQEPNSRIIIMFFMGLIAVSSTTLYDFISCRELGIKIKNKDLFRLSWIANSTNNFVGAGGIAGGSLRTALYKKEGIETKKAINISLIIWLTTLTGLSSLIWLNIKYITLLDNKIYMFLSIIFSLYIFVYFFINKIPYLKTKFKNNIVFNLPVKTKYKLVLVAILEWSMASLFFAYLMHVFTPQATLRQSIVVFILAMIIGLCSFIPGGIGSFDLACIYGFNLFSINSPGILVGIILYRVFYYIVPWVLSMILLVEEFLDEKKKNSNKDLNIINEFGIKALSALTFFSGTVLIISATMPMVVDRFEFINKFLSIPMLQFSQLTVMGIGFILIILSKGILDKVKGSYSVTLTLLIIGALITLIKGLSFEAAIFLIIIAVLLYLSKDKFYRESTPLKPKGILVSIGIILLTTFMYLIIYEAMHNHMLFNPYKFLINEFMYKPKTIFSYLFILCIITFMIHIVTVKRLHFTQPTDKDLEELNKFLQKYDGNSKTHLLFLKDKSFYYAMDKKVLIAFKAFKDKMIVLGDPIGDKSLFKEAINEFRLYADKYNMIPVFYEIDEENLPLYHENGYNFFKLGEEAVVDLENFTLDGKKKADLRYIKNKMEKGLFQFEMLYPPIDNDIILKLKEISDQWLEGRKEKGFSLGWFNKEYINLSPVGIIKKDEEIIAFATIMPGYDDKTVGIDLMRLIPKPPNGTMDALFYSLIKWAQENEYKQFNLGMAPLSNVGVNKFSKKGEQMGKYLFIYGSKIYSFKGLRRYKEKFDPSWHGRYLAYPFRSNLPVILVDLATLVSKAPKK